MPPKPQEIFIESPLYRKFNVTNGDKEEVVDLLNGDLSIKCYCASCKDESIFVTPHVNRSKPASLSLPMPTLNSGSAEELLKQRHRESMAKPLEMSVCRIITFHCAKCRDNNLLFVIQIREGVLQKIGQLPSISELSNYKSKDYRKILGDDLGKEFYKAIGLAAHDVGIGSYVYLRRILELHIINPAIERARVASKPKWNEKKYNSARKLVDKMKLDFVAAQLPKALTDNPIIYSILSKGIHQLSEEECLEHFNVVRLVITMILDDEIRNREEAANREQMASLLSKVKQSIT